eukprot:TRINITY_DN12206_c0_g1_i1.p1 TRINITY_DN12206_c0_g1~~TRINITY_DN12206_c0_g1_i1.p1  ORF type:complete len:526 (-),score=60.65 TRINITY_DN12206_c0_g1_i1:113-1690(-)
MVFDARRLVPQRTFVSSTRRSACATGRRGRLLALVGLGNYAVQAQLYQFDQDLVPESRTIRPLYTFHVYSHADAPDKTFGSPFVKFHGLRATPAQLEQTDKRLNDYAGLELTLLPLEDFLAFMRLGKFCSGQAAAGIDKLLVPRDSSGVVPESFISHRVSFTGQHSETLKDQEVILRSTGIFVLMFSNCGSFAQATVSGSVMVKNAYGFLPGNEYPKMPFFGWLCLCYFVLAAIWFGLVMRGWRDLVQIQMCIAVVIFLGLVETSLWYVFLNDWNTDGLRNHGFLTMAILATVVKSIVSYMLVLVACLGWGVTLPYLDKRTTLKIEIVSLLYIVFAFLRLGVHSFRSSHDFSTVFLGVCAVPLCLLDGFIFYWIFSAVSELMEKLRNRRQTQKLLLFTRLWKFLVGALSFGFFAVMSEIVSFLQGKADRWQHQWLYSDGFSRLISFSVLVYIMYLWTPGSNSKWLAYSASAENSDTEKNDTNDAPPWEDEDIVDEAEDDSFWATTHGQEKIGAPAAKPQTTEEKL